MIFSNQSLKKLIIPLVIEQMLIILVGMADTIMVSYAGESAMSGVALVDMYAFMVITILTAVSTGGAVIVSQYLGNKDYLKANLSSSQLITVSFIISLLVMTLSLVFHKEILRLFFNSVENDVMKAADTYLLITGCSFPFLGIYDSSAAIYRSMEKTNTTMYISFLMNIINAVGNFVGIFILHMGVIGVAIPTLISRIIAGFIMTSLVFQKTNIIYANIKDIFLWKPDYIKRILKIAVPNGIENGLFALGKILVTSIVALFGTSQIAASSVSLSVGQAAILVVNAVNFTMVTVVGQCVGANEYEQAEKYIIKLMKISYISTVILSGLVCIFLPIILSFYDLSGNTYNLSCILIIIHNIASILLHPTSFNLPNGLRAAGDAKFTMFTGICSMIIFRLGIAYLFGIIFNMGIIGVWIAMVTDWSARSVSFILRFKGGKWKRYRAI